MELDGFEGVTGNRKKKISGEAAAVGSGSDAAEAKKPKIQRSQDPFKHVWLEGFDDDQRVIHPLFIYFYDMNPWSHGSGDELRNQWSKLSSLRQQWSSSSSAARSHATCLVNAYLSRIYMPSMELGVFEQHALYSKQSSLKLAKQQQFHRSNLLSSYRDMGQSRLLLSGFLVLQIIGVTLETAVAYRFLHFGQSLVLRNMLMRLFGCLCWN